MNNSKTIDTKTTEFETTNYLLMKISKRDIFIFMVVI